MLQKIIKHAVAHSDSVPPFIKQTGRKLLITAGYLTYYVRPLPDFVIIGAQKSGTTSLYSYLIQHPCVRPGYKKEVHFFDNPDHFRKGAGWYRAHFPSDLPRRIRSEAAAITGEATPSYLCHPDVPARMYQVIPHAKFIVLLRNPVYRAYSHYNHRVKHGTETLPFEAALKKNSEKFSSYLARGIYADQLERWMRIFPREQFLILGSEDFFRNPEDALLRVVSFLDLPHWNPDPKIFRRYNVNRYSDMDEKVKKYLTDYFAPHNERLYRYLGADFGW
ncbi:sulfotransferase [Desulfococcaceae bacterium HSG8]|nr:sulfotransferase [Desulfococcaceae bacterium HSG8]